MKVFSRLTPIPQTALELDPFHHGLDLEQMLAQRDGEQDVPAYHLDILHARGDAGVGKERNQAHLQNESGHQGGVRTPALIEAEKLAQSLVILPVRHFLGTFR